MSQVSGRKCPRGMEENAPSMKNIYPWEDLNLWTCHIGLVRRDFREVLFKQFWLMLVNWDLIIIKYQVLEYKRTFLYSGNPVRMFVSIMKCKDILKAFRSAKCRVNFCNI